MTENLFSERSGERRVRWCTAVLLLAGLFCTPGLAATLTVCPSGCNYTSIQAAIDAAAPFDTIRVMPGTYHENLEVNTHDLDIEGSGADITIINGSYAGNVVNITADDVIMHDFTLTAGMRPLDIHDMMTAGILVDQADGVVIAQITVTDCYLGIYANNTTNLILSGNDVHDNDWIGIFLPDAYWSAVDGNIARDNGMGIFTDSVTGLHAGWNNLTHNEYDGLCMINGVTDAVIEANTITGNCYLHPTWVGDYNTAGGALRYADTIKIRHNTFADNGGHGIFISGMEDSVMEGNVLTGNYAGFSYNGVEPSPGNTIAANNTVDGLPIVYLEGAEDQVVTGPAATVYCMGCTNVTIRGLTLSQRNGFGILACGGSGIVARDNTVSNNAFQNILFILTEDSVIAGNTLRDAMYGTGVTGADNVSVTGNYATGCAHGIAAASENFGLAFDGNILEENDVGLGFEYAKGDGTRDGISATGNSVTGHGTGSGAMDVGIHLMDSMGICSDRNTIGGCYEAVWVNGGDRHVVNNTTVNGCQFGIEVSDFTIGLGEPTPARYSVIAGNNISAGKRAFLITSGNQWVYGNRIFLNNFSTTAAQEDPVVGGIVHAPPAPVAWGLGRSAEFLVPAPDTSSYHKPNVFNTRTTVRYAYRNRTFTGYLGNYWSHYNGTDTGRNGVGTTPQPVFRNNTDNYPLISRTDAYDLNPLPGLQADFTASPRNGTAPLSVQFTDKSTGNPLYRQWNFGDSPLTFTGTNPVHVYQKSGTFNVTLRIMSMNGTSTKKKTAYITVTAKPKAKFFANATFGFPPLSVRFTDRSTESPTAWSWSFGDGTNSVLQNPVHVYTRAGTYTVRLNATNAAGTGSLTKTGYITVPVMPVYPV